VKAALWAAATAALVIGIDQGAKALVRANVRPGSRDGVFPGLEIVNARNRGVAFNLLEGKTGIVTLITVAVLVGLLVFFALNRTRPVIWLPTGMLVGGALGNVIDRATRDDGVTDFLKLPAWPAFNVADMAIVLGVLALAYVVEGPRAKA
jgi:signal peptidase II